MPDRVVVHICRTNIVDRECKERVISLLSARLPGSKITVDLHDCDKVLRIAGPYTSAELEAGLEQVKQAGILVEELE